MVTPTVMATVPGTPLKAPPAPSTPARVGAQPLIEAANASNLEAETDDEGWVHVGGDKHLFSPAASEQASEVVGSNGSQVGDMDSETTQEDSEQSTPDSDVESVVQQPLVVQEPGLNFFINEKSLVIHRERSPGLLKCGRKVSPHFMIVYDLHGIRCSRCFVV